MSLAIILLFGLVNGQSSNTTNKINSLVPPVRNLDDALKISFQINIQDINNVRDINMDFTVDFVLEETWMLPYDACSDYAITLQPFNLSSKSGGTIIVPGVQVRKFWIPDTVISNAKQVTASSSHLETLHFKSTPNGSCGLKYAARKQAVIGCKMDFHQYPNDIQTCIMVMRSYSYPSDVLIYGWRDANESLELNPDVMLLQQEIQVYQGELLVEVLDVYYSTIVVNFKFERRLLNSLVQLYAPSGLIVILSWFSFWMGFDAIPARVALCITSLLTVVTQGSSARLSLPRISYICGMDVWLLSCMFFVFLTILEFTIANLQRKRKIAKEPKNKPTNSGKTRRHTGNVIPFKLKGDHLALIKPNKQPRLTIRLRSGSTALSHHGFLEVGPPFPDVYNMGPWVKVPLSYSESQFKENQLVRNWMELDLDQKAQIIFPLGFIIFNLIYWPVLIFRKF